MLSKEQIDRLERAAHAEAIGNLMALVDPQTVVDLLAMLRDAQKDAARYRFIREFRPGLILDMLYEDEPIRNKAYSSDLDAAIYAAMQRDCDGVQHANQDDQ